MNIEELRAEFEAWYRRQHIDSEPLIWVESVQAYREFDHNQIFGAYQAGRAALQSQDREDAARFRFCLKHGFPQKWEEMIRGSLRYYWTSRPGSQEEFSSAIEAIDHARRVEGEGE